MAESVLRPATALSALTTANATPVMTAFCFKQEVVETMIG